MASRLTVAVRCHRLRLKVSMLSSCDSTAFSLSLVGSLDSFLLNQQQWSKEAWDPPISYLSLGTGHLREYLSSEWTGRGEPNTALKCSLSPAISTDYLGLGWLCAVIECGRAQCPFLMSAFLIPHASQNSIDSDRKTFTYWSKHSKCKGQSKDRCWSLFY